MSRVRHLLFPEPPRKLPAERLIRMGLRTAHIGAFAVLLGGHVFDVDAERLRVALWLTVGTGAAFMALELLGSFTWLFEMRAWLMFLKLALLCLVPLFWEQRTWLLLVILVAGSACSHMPGRFRHYSLIQHRVIDDPRKG